MIPLPLVLGARARGGRLGRTTAPRARAACLVCRRAARAASRLAPRRTPSKAWRWAPRPARSIVKMKLKEPMANPPAGFSLTNPPRIAFDFPNTVNALGKTTQDVKEGDLRSIRIGQGANRTRVVFSLDKAARFDAAVDGQNVVITLQPSMRRAHRRLPSESTHFADAAPRPKPHSVRDIDFKRGTWRRRSGRHRSVRPGRGYRSEAVRQEHHRRAAADRSCRSRSSAASTSPTSARRSTPWR